jgi:hypothetical protein
MNGFNPQTGRPDEWNAAFYRLEDYLRAHGVVNKIHQSQIILRVMERAARKHEATPKSSPLELALREMYLEMAHWFQRIFPDLSGSPARICSIGRVSLYLSNAAERWPDVFLAEGELPPEFIQTMQETFIQSGPDLRVSTMIPRDPDLPEESDLLKEAWQRLDQFFSVKL